MRGGTAKQLRAIMLPPYPTPMPVIGTHKTNRGVFPRALVGDKRRLLYKLAKQLWYAQPHDAKSYHLIVWHLIHLTGGPAPKPVPSTPAPAPLMRQAVRNALRRMRHV